MPHMSTPSVPALQTVPAPLPQPIMSAYGLAELNLLPQYTADQVLAATGSYSPNSYDPTQLTKTWIASIDQSGNPITAATPTVTFTYWKAVPGSLPVLTSFSLTGPQALAFNIPGQPNYPQYTIAPTPATIGGAPLPPGAQGPDGFNPGLLSTYAQALAMAEAMGMTPAQATAAVVNNYDTMYAPFTFVANGETRQPWVIMWPQASGASVPINVGIQMQLNAQNGVGYPGVWGNLTGGVGTPTFTFSNAPAPAPNPNFAPVPQRQLLPNESFTLGPFGDAQVSRNDLPPGTDQV